MTYLLKSRTLYGMEFRTIYTTSNAINIPLIKHALTLEGIPFHITNESLLFSLGVVAMGNSGSEIRVSAQDEKAARKLLCKLDLVC